MEVLWTIILDFKFDKISFILKSEKVYKINFWSRLVKFSTVLSLRSLSSPRGIVK
jgi:hypothetical protein